MKIETRTDIVRTVIITFPKGEKRKAIDYCFDNDLDIKTIYGQELTATKIISPEDICKKN